LQWLEAKVKEASEIEARAVQAAAEAAKAASRARQLQGVQDV
jgi:hypothetical protein